MEVKTPDRTPEELSLSPGKPFWRLPGVAAGVGIAALALSVLLGWGDGRQFWSSYLVAALFYLTVALGGLFFVLLQFVTRAGWSVVVRRLAEHLMGTLPWVAVLLLVALGLGFNHLYEWGRPDKVLEDPLLQHKSPYLNPTFFFLRSVFYLASWSLIAWWFRRWSLLQDRSGDLAITGRLQIASAPCLVLFGLTLTFASFDWIMSMDPHWYSTIFGVYLFAGCFLAILSALILLILALQGKGLLADAIGVEHLHDLGKLLFGFVVFWGYIAFSQFMLIWYGNIPEETAWYYHRLQHGWTGVTVVLVLGHFVLPFFFLLSREVKRKRLTLGLAAAWVLVFHYVDLYWLVMPGLQEHGFSPHVLDLTSLIGLGGLFLAGLGLLMRGASLVPLKDPRLEESLSFENI